MQRNLLMLIVDSEGNYYAEAVYRQVARWLLQEIHGGDLQDAALYLEPHPFNTLLQYMSKVAIGEQQVIADATGKPGVVSAWA